MTGLGDLLATARLTLPRDVVLTPVTRFPPAFRRDIRAAAGTVAITRPRSRVVTKLLDRDGAALVARFAHPATVAEAIVQFAQATGAHAPTVLRRAFPLLVQLLESGLLVREGSDLARPIAATFRRGHRLGPFELRRAVHVTVDTEVYRACNDAGRACALKLARPLAPAGTIDGLAHEADVLARLRRSPAPTLLGHGTVDGLAYLATEWLEGRAFASMRADEGAATPPAARVALARRVAESYALVHARAVVHGDVHPGNLLVEASGAVRILDFANAVMDAPRGRHPRGLVLRYAEPEYARALLAGHAPPAPTAAGEQYAVAALLYELLSGRSYVELSADQATLLRQVASEAPRAFDANGAWACPEVERVLARALHKDPAGRFGTMRAFARALRAAHVPGLRPARPARAPALMTRVLHELWEVARTGESAADAAPTASVHFGAAGIALGLLHVAWRRDDADALALADVWLARARRESRRHRGHMLPDVTPALQRLVPASLFHGPAGVVTVEALVSHAHGEPLRPAVGRLVNLVRAVRPALDVGFGDAGILVAVTGLRALSGADPASRGRLERLGQQLMRRIARAAGSARVSGGPHVPLNLGIAHGWAGVAYAALRWCASTGGRPPAALEARLDELAGRAEQVGAGARWPWLAAGTSDHGANRYMAGWCNGSAGFVHLWVAAGEQYRAQRFDALAERAGHYVWAHQPPTWELCCGAAGAAYALLALYRRTGDCRWLSRAQHLARRAVRQASASAARAVGPYRHCLMRGLLGAAVLEADMDAPREARMPLFEALPWRVSPIPAEVGR